MAQTFKRAVSRFCHRVRRRWWLVFLFIIWELAKDRVAGWANTQIEQEMGAVMQATAQAIKYAASSPLTWTILVAIAVVLILFIHSYVIEYRKTSRTPVDNQVAPLVEIDAKGRNYVRFELGKYDYQDFKITIEDFIPQIEGNELYLHAGDDAGLWTVGYSILNLNEAEKEEGEPVLAENLASNPTRSGQIEIILYRPFIVGAERRISFKSYVYTQLKMYSKKEGEIMFKHSLEPITQIQIFIGKGNILSGVFRLYGMSGA